MVYQRTVRTNPELKKHVIDKLVDRNLREKLKKYKSFGLISIACIFVSFFCFAGLGFLAMSQNWPFYIIFIPFVGFPLFALNAARLSMKYSYINSIVLFADEISQYDAVLLAKVEALRAETGTKAYLTEKLIQTGNLAGYRLIAGVMAAKEEKYISDSAAMKEHDDYMRLKANVYNAPEKTESALRLENRILCPGCGAEIDTESNYCPKCGTRIFK